MVEGFAITFVGVLQLVGLVAAFQLGRQLERPKSKWPQGSLMQGGWEAWRLPLLILVGVAAGITIFLPILAEVGLGGLLPSFDGVGGGGGQRGGRGGSRGASRGRQGYARGGGYDSGMYD